MFYLEILRVVEHLIQCVPAIVDGPWLPKNFICANFKSGKSNSSQAYGGSCSEWPDLWNSSGCCCHNHQFELFAANSWAKNDWTVQGARDGVGNSPISKPHIGGLYTPPDVQSLWSY
ncbi:UNVERIFIED_CONTAM: hypothetical protein Sangu_1331400 [Sesamum angustifolium]|uniref:Uncharacterized protein n=1 Tax=Sesamum angustifolium TaxID=2727405 RepID=A0AAW2N501_9LAMI